MAHVFADAIAGSAAAPLCACGGRHANALACAGEPPEDGTGPLGAAAEAAVLHAAFPRERTRRELLGRFGSAAVLAAVAEAFPLGRAREALAQGAAGAAPEKRDLKIGFIPITCATPIIMAHPMGFYARHGLNVEVVRTAGWAVIRDKAIAREYDAAHMLSPMPLAMSLGVGVAAPIPWAVAAIENTNGQAITLATKHKEKRDPKDWRGFRFAVPFDFSMHNYLLRHYLAEHGLDPDRDVQIRSVPPPEMVANLRADNIDGYLGPDPFNQRAVFDGVGFIHLLTRELWDGHPCCAFAVPRAMVAEAPEHLRRPVARHRRGDRPRRQAGEPQGGGGGDLRAELPEPAADGGGAGADRHLRRRAGPGAARAGPDRLRPLPLAVHGDLDPHPDAPLGAGAAGLDYPQVAEQVFLALDAGRAMRELGLPVPASATRGRYRHGPRLRPGAASRLDRAQHPGRR